MSPVFYPPHCLATVSHVFLSSCSIASRLIKQTFSARVDVDGRRKKWHLGELIRASDLSAS